MEETRTQVYLQLIETLLNCPNDEELPILQANLELVDSGFLQFCEVVAENLVEEGQENQANYLRNLASQIGQFLGMNDDGESDNSEGENPQEYAKFIGELLQAEADIRGDIKVIYPMLAGRQHLLNDRFAETLQQVTQNLIAEHPKAIEFTLGLIGNLISHISDFPQGERANNLEIAITGYQILLSNREPGSEKWALTQNNLAIAYSDRIRGEKAQNIESAIASYTAALTVYTRDAFPKKWAQTQNNLAIAYTERVRGEKAQNIELAIASYTAALSVLTREAFSEYLATTQNNLGVAYRNRIRGEKAQNIELAIAYFTAALTVLTPDAFPEKWALTRNNLGIAYSYRIRGEKAENIELAIASYTAALSVRTRDAFPEDCAQTQNNLGIAYSNRIRGEKAENIELAIASYTAALSVYTCEAFPEEWAQTQNNLGVAYSDRIRGEKAENIELAIASYTAALTVLTRDAFPEYWAGTQNNLGEAYRHRIRGEKAQNIELAKNYYHNALTIRTRDATREAFPQKYTETLFNLGNLYRSNQQWKLAYDTYAAAIETVEFLRGEIQSGDETKQKLAEEWNQLYRNMVEVCLKLKNYTEAIEYVERSKARNLVELVATRELYPKGDLPQTVLKELSRLRQEIDAEQRRLDNQQTNRNSNGGTISGERGLQIDTLQTTSRDQTHLTQLRQQLDELVVRDIKPIDPDFLLTQEVKGIFYSDIQALTAENTAILEWYILGDKFLTFIITPQSPNPIVWQSSKADFQALVNWGEEYLRDYQEEDQTQWQWRENLAPRLQSLSEILHINEILGKVPKHCDRLILIPHIFLHLFPLHALAVSPETWKRFNPETQSPEPINPYLLDCFKQGVRYSPSCQLLQQAQRRKRPNFTHLFAVQNPSNDLNCSDLEVQVISQHFDFKDILIQRDAKKLFIDNSRLRITHCAHFSCHGYFNFNQPLLSALLLADCELPPPPPEENPTRYLPLQNGNTLDLTKCLTFADIFDLDLRECRLVVLSACETGISEFNSISDEYISLPSGFLAAGSSSVVATLWAVSDLSASFLMIKFYQLLKAGLSVSLALKSAQVWLRDATKEDLQLWTSKLTLSPTQKIVQLPALFNKMEAKAKPFQSPYHWAAFCAIGQ
ncbi:CHAT domain-containing protein [Microcoleus vaginatus]|uniref:CHAT domain-containing protein n=1 Tax=Microcoleus vaginatus TaxID=119532 RepID=UPI001F61F983|nr:CHAT domain-containing protein [Microcoleus vaginatus HSN003]